ncbi:hypothetical protein OTU49_002209 [Cherax quadricarinatus]
MIISGRSSKPLGKRTYKKLRKCGAKQGDSLSEFMDSLTLYTSQVEEINHAGGPNFDGVKSHDGSDKTETKNCNLDRNIHNSSGNETQNLNMLHQIFPVLNTAIESSQEFR